MFAKVRISEQSTKYIPVFSLIISSIPFCLGAKHIPLNHLYFDFTGRILFQDFHHHFRLYGPMERELIRLQSILDTRIIPIPFFCKPSRTWSRPKISTWIYSNLLNLAPRPLKFYIWLKYMRFIKINAIFRYNKILFPMSPVANGEIYCG